MNVLVGLDGVTVSIDSPWWPEPKPAFVASPPGSGIQAATCTSLQPTFGEVSLVAVPFGLAAPTEKTGLMAGPGVAPQFLAALSAARGQQNGAPLVAPAVSMFGNQVDGLAHVVDVSVDGGPARRAMVAEWAAEAGQRLWILRVARAADPGQADAALQAFVDTLATVTVSTDETALQATPSTLALAPELTADLASPAAAPPASGFGGGPAGAPLLPPPPWWQGPFNDGHYFNQSGRHSFGLGATFNGLVACGPRPMAGGTDAFVQFFSGARGQLEFECVELVMRWLYQAYGVPPYPGNGNDVVTNFPGGGGLVVVPNGTPNQAPVPGDVISLGPFSQFGHTAVVTDSQVDPATGNGVITIIEQNSSPGGRQPLNVTNWQVNAWIPVIGWLHQQSQDGSAIVAMRFIWTTKGLPFDATFAIPRAWLAQLRAGSYPGQPLGPEVPIAGAGAVFQVFEHGLATFLPGQAATFTGAGITDAQLAGIAQTPFLWGTTIPFNASFGIPHGWLAQLRAGSYPGRPLSAEAPIPNAPAGAVFQVFERGLATFVPGQGATFNGGALTDGQLGGIAQTPFLWGTNTAFVPGFAIPLVWLAQLRAGQYAGRPLSAEAPVPNGPAGAVYQVFERGLATFVPGQAATFTGTGLSDAQLAGILPSPHLWGSTIPFNATFAIPQAWLAQLRAGSYRGRPLSPEVSLPGAAAGAVLQVFEYGLALYRPGQGVSWTG